MTNRLGFMAYLVTTPNLPLCDERTLVRLVAERMRIDLDARVEPIGPTPDEAQEVNPITSQ